jgi:molybdopterin-guanine dinucleotide biosynthesis protein A
MGVDKAFLSLGEELLIERQLRILRETGAGELLISGRREADYSGLDVRVVYDRRPECGPLGGLAALLQAAEFSPVLVVAVDMPNVSVEILQRLLSHSTEAMGCVPVTGTGYQPLAAVYPKAALAIAEDHLARGQYAVRTFVEAATNSGLLRPFPIAAMEEELFFNWNRPSDRKPDGRD